MVISTSACSRVGGCGGWLCRCGVWCVVGVCVWYVWGVWCVGVLCVCGVWYEGMCVLSVCGVGGVSVSGCLVCVCVICVCVCVV